MRTTDECFSLVGTEMARAGVFHGGSGNFRTSRWTNAAGEEVASIGYWVITAPGGGLALHLSYAITDLDTREKTPLDYPVEITTTPCHLGGQRYWFRCPLVRDGSSCRRRVGKLYQPPGGRYFGCRTCYNLTYRSAQEHDKRVDALIRLGPEAFERAMKSPKVRDSLLAIKAAFKVLDKHGRG